MWRSLSVAYHRVIEKGKRRIMSKRIEAAKTVKIETPKTFRSVVLTLYSGYLFFLPNGIVFGFRKPVAFFAFSAIDSISYTSVLQRTFNLVISARETPEAEPKDIEFSMIDQVDFAGIDEYIKRHELNDASMAADRRAKAYNVNKDKKAESTGDAVDGAEGDDGQTELQKAEQALQDQEDDEEEDYDPSGGESEGEGEDSDEDEEEYGDAGDEEGAEEFEHEEDVEE